ncbi:hypothetical protein O3P69_020883 [Scylla paramamosain]|uniref:Uncharacterized protein n=1 Tax=Scylla paramamosain TaxID=85552 RepID=A0AAW0TPI2_SCYPA
MNKVSRCLVCVSVAQSVSSRGSSVSSGGASSGDGSGPDHLPAAGIGGSTTDEGEEAAAVAETEPTWNITKHLKATSASHSTTVYHVAPSRITFTPRVAGLAIRHRVPPVPSRQRCQGVSQPPRSPDTIPSPSASRPATAAGPRDAVTLASPPPVHLTTAGLPATSTFPRPHPPLTAIAATTPIQGSSSSGRSHPKCSPLPFLRQRLGGICLAAAHLLQRPDVTQGAGLPWVGVATWTSPGAAGHKHSSQIENLKTGGREGRRSGLWLTTHNPPDGFSPLTGDHGGGIEVPRHAPGRSTLRRHASLRGRHEAVAAHAIFSYNDVVSWPTQTECDRLFIHAILILRTRTRPCDLHFTINLLTRPSSLSRATAPPTLTPCTHTFHQPTMDT